MNIAIFASILLGLAWVAFNTYRNAQATGTIAHILHETEQPRSRVDDSAGR